MSSRILFKVMIAGTTLAATCTHQSVFAIDRFFDGSPTGTGTDYYTGVNWSTADTVPTAQFHQRAVIGTTGQTTLEARSYILGDVAIPLDSLLGLVLAPPSDPEAFELLSRERKVRADSIDFVPSDNHPSPAVLEAERMYQLF